MNNSNINTNTKTDQLLQAILQELKQINASMSASKHQLGFAHAPKSRYIYANRKYSCLWYFWNGALQQPEPIEAGALTGFIDRIEIEEKEFKNQVDSKLNLHVQADRRYVIQSGLDTLFAKALLYALFTIPGDLLDKPMTIVPEAGDSEQVLFCRIYDASGNPIFAQYSSETDWQQVIQVVSNKVNRADRNGNGNGNGNGNPKTVSERSLSPTPVATAASTSTSVDEVWRTWKNPEDAISWAIKQLPFLAESEIRTEFANLSTPDGKKAVVWIKRVEELLETEI